jgi:hypothetical protein
MSNNSVIYKYELKPGYLKIEMPIDAKILHVDEQLGNICIWAEVNLEHATEVVSFEVVSTGKIMESKFRKYLGTVKLYNGSLIFHVFKVNS